jgi:hypothetical protein
LSGIGLRNTTSRQLTIEQCAFVCIRLCLPAHFQDGKPQLLVSESLE